MFHQVSKHLEVGQKTRLRLVFSTHFSGFGYPDETLFLVFDILHEGDGLIVNILVLAPEIKDLNSFCVVEHLTPLKFNLSGKCFTGPVQHTNLALTTCPNSKEIVSVRYVF